jgi:hypothetical protein
MPDIGTLANLAGIVSGLAVIGGAAFAVIQLREYRKQRRDDAAVELVRSFYNADFARSVRLIRLLPDGCKAAELRAKGSEHEEAAILVSFACRRKHLNTHYSGKRGKGEAFDHAKGNVNAADVLLDWRVERILLLGKNVARCFGFRDLPFLAEIRIYGRRFLIFPHPSGTNRW